MNEQLTTAGIAESMEHGEHEEIHSAGTARARDERQPLFPEKETQEMRNRWDDIQASFVDEPRGAVQQADGLVADAIKRLANMFASERTNLEKQWGRGEDVSTEDLRVALQRYRSFFSRLLSV